MGSPHFPVRRFTLSLAVIAISSLGCETTSAQPATGQQPPVAQELQFSLLNAHILGSSVSVQIEIRNISNLRQYAALCFTNSGASLTSGLKLSIATHNVNGLPWTLEPDIKTCLKSHTAETENMIPLEPQEKDTILLNFFDPNQKPIGARKSISFPVDLIVRTAAAAGPGDTSATAHPPGAAHIVHAPFRGVPSALHSGHAVLKGVGNAARTVEAGHCRSSR